MCKNGSVNVSCRRIRNPAGGISNGFTRYRRTLPPIARSRGVAGKTTLWCNARQVMRSNAPSFMSSMRFVSILIPGTPSNPARWCRNAAFLVEGSSNVTTRSGACSFNTIPGNPAPLPTSNTRSPGRGSKILNAAMESRKCLLTISSSVSIPVKFILAFHLTSSCRYRTNRHAT